MITDIPTADEFMQTGLSLLDFAWDTVATLLTDLDDSEFFGVDVPEVSDAFWQASKQRLTTSLAVAQQGVEFALKGRIAAVSPFLLVAGSPKGWPSGCQKRDTNFADFHTIDSQDLIKVHDTVATTRLSDIFISKFENLRRIRNAIMHTVDKRVNIHVIDVVSAILSMYKQLFPTISWVQVRREFLERSPLSELYSSDFVEPRVIWEFSLIVELLSPEHVKEFFGFNKRQRRYICPNCNHQSGDNERKPKTAILKPNTLGSTTIHCFVCDTEIKVERADCPDPDCRGNVLSVEYGVCTTCGGKID